MTDFPNRAKQSNFEETLAVPIDSSQTTGIILSDVPDYASGGEVSYFTILDPKGIEHITATGWNSGTNTLTGVTRGVVGYSGGSSTAVAHGAGVKVIMGVPWQNLDDINTALVSKVDLAGDSMTGDLDWNTTTKQGLVVNSLTTAQRDALGTATNGAIIYNTTTGVAQLRDSGAWVNLETGTPVANANTTTAGVVEIATEAEAGAGTNAGSTGAELAVGPPELAAVIQDQQFSFAADAEASDTYVITLTPAPDAYATGQRFTFTANTANTGAATLNVNALGAKTIKKHNDQDLENNDIESGSVVEVVYDGTNMQMVTPTATQMSSANSSTLTAGTSSVADGLHVHGAISLTLTETVSAGDAVFMWSAFNAPRIGNMDQVGENVAAAKVEERAVRFKPENTDTLDNVKVFLAKNNTDVTMQLEVQTQSGSDPSGTPITNGTSNNVSVVSDRTSASWKTFTWSTPPTLTAGTTYWLVLKSTTPDATNYAWVPGIDSGENANSNYFNAKSKINGSWTADRGFNYHCSGKNFGLIVGKADALISGQFEFMHVVGIALEGGNDGDTINVQTSGMYTTTGLIPGMAYYLNSTAGTYAPLLDSGYTSETSTYMGTAISTTQLKLPNQWVTFLGDSINAYQNGEVPFHLDAGKLIIRTFEDANTDQLSTTEHFAPFNNNVVVGSGATAPAGAMSATVDPTNGHINTAGAADATDTTMVISYRVF